MAGPGGDFDDGARPGRCRATSTPMGTAKAIVASGAEDGEEQVVPVLVSSARRRCRRTDRWRTSRRSEPTGKTSATASDPVDRRATGPSAPRARRSAPGASRPPHRPGSARPRRRLHRSPTAMTMVSTTSSIDRTAAGVRSRSPVGRVDDPGEGVVLQHRHRPEVPEGVQRHEQAPDAAAGPHLPRRHRPERAPRGPAQAPGDLLLGRVHARIAAITGRYT